MRSSQHEQGAGILRENPLFILLYWIKDIDCPTKSDFLSRHPLYVSGYFCCFIYYQKYGIIFVEKEER